MRKHHDLRVWQESIALVKKIYAVTELFPKTEIYSLTSQMRRAAISIPSNIAEGAARNSNKEFLQFLYISRGSLSELETHIIIAIELKYMNQIDEIENMIEKTYALLGGLIKSIKSRKI